MKRKLEPTRSQEALYRHAERFQVRIHPFGRPRGAAARKVKSGRRCRRRVADALGSAAGDVTQPRTNHGSGLNLKFLGSYEAERNASGIA